MMAIRKHPVRMKEVEAFAHKQWEKSAYEGDTDNAIGFIHKGQYIIDPWVDPSGRFDIDTETAMEIYGYDKIIWFIKEVRKEITKRR